MSTADDIKMALMKVVANMPDSVSRGNVTISDCIARGIIVQQADMEPVLQMCDTAAKQANAEALSRPQAVSIHFDFAPEAQGGGIFRFERLRAQGY